MLALESTVGGGGRRGEGIREHSFSVVVEEETVAMWRRIDQTRTEKGLTESNLFSFIFFFEKKF